MSSGDIETFHEDGAWYNQVDGADGYLGDGHSTREEAVAAGRKAARARGVQHAVYDTDGRIGQGSTHDHGRRA